MYIHLVGSDSLDVELAELVHSLPTAGYYLGVEAVANELSQSQCLTPIKGA